MENYPDPSFSVVSVPFPSRRNRHCSVAIPCSSTILVVGGAGNLGTISCSMTLYNVKTKEITRLPNLKKPLAQHMATVVGNYLYIIGGVQSPSLDACNSVLRMSLVTKSWDTVNPMITARRGHCAAVHNDKIYVLGGYSESSVEYFDTTEIGATWHSIGGMGSLMGHRFCAAAVTVGHKIYVIGGYIAGVPSKSMTVFDVFTKCCVEVAQMPVALADHSAVVYRQYIIVIGGISEDCRAVRDECFVYDVEKNVWFDDRQRMAIPRYLHSTTLFDSGKLVVTMGRDRSGKATNSMEEIFVLGLLPREIRNREIREADQEGRLPIHIAAEQGLEWGDGMKFLAMSYPESLAIPNKNGNIPIISAANAGKLSDLSSIYEIFRIMLGFGYF